MPHLGDVAATETLERAHRRAHDLCGVGPTMGFIATGKAARTVEQLLLAPLKAGRALTTEEIAKLRDDLVELRHAAQLETQTAGHG